MIKLGAFDFELKHRQGKQHTNTDGMFRAKVKNQVQTRMDLSIVHLRPSGQGKGSSLVINRDLVTVIITYYSGRKTDTQISQRQQFSAYEEHRSR